MNNKVKHVVSAAMILLLAGCQSTKTGLLEGAVVGAAVGATAGGVIGHQHHYGSKGAGIGAAIGALTGALVGSQINKTPQAGTSQAVNPQQISVQQVVDYTKQGINEYVIIDKIRLTNSTYVLTEADVSSLQQQGVAQQVIDAMRAQPLAR